MTIEQATFAISIIVLVMQGVSLYTSARIKVWVLERFVSKADFLETLTLWSNQDQKQNSRSNRNA
jgi:hypothetical protein